jgi:endonuclease YncB( thermonuclease family)
MSKHRFDTGVITFIVCGLFLALTGPSGAATIQGTASVIDGDTLEVHGERIRLHGIDAPESAQTCELRNGKQWRCGQEAANELSDYIARRPVICEGQDRDRYGRLIAVCSVGGLDLNLWLVEQGWAVAYRHYSTDYVDPESKARAKEIGIWSSTFDMPWDYRESRWTEAGTKAPDPNCPIKGNINSKGERIYHTPWGSRSYDRTKINTAKGERWFCDEAEAVAAGWRAPYN